MIEPGSQQWWEARLGSWSASRAPTLMARGAKGQKLAGYEDLIGEIATERLTQTPVTHFVTDAMQRGLEMEADALDAYALERMAKLGPSQLVLHPTLDHVCATPDRFVGDDGLVEAKCPTNKLKHLDTLVGGRKSLVHEYRDQCLWQLWCSEREWCDLVSFHPGFPPAQQVAIVRIVRDEKRFAEFAEAVEEAEAMVADILAKLEQLTTGQVEAA